MITENNKEYIQICGTLVGREWGWLRYQPNIGFQEKKYLDAQGKEVEKDSPDLVSVKTCQIKDDFSQELSSAGFLDACGRYIPGQPGEQLGTVVVTPFSSTIQMATADFNIGESYLGSSIVLKTQSAVIDNASPYYFTTVSELTNLSGNPPSTNTFNLPFGSGVPDGTYDVCLSGVTFCEFQDCFSLPFLGVIPCVSPPIVANRLPAIEAREAALRDELAELEAQRELIA